MEGFESNFPKLTVYPWRWCVALLMKTSRNGLRVVLASFSVMSLSNAMVWNTFSPVARTTKEFFDVPSVYVDALSFVFMVVYIPFIVPASWILSKYNIAVGVMVGGETVWQFNDLPLKVS